MRKSTIHMRMAIGALVMLCIVAFAAPLSAQDRNPDGSVNPNASAVNEQQLLQELNRIQGRVTIPDKKEGVLIQPAGREWREFHQVTLLLDRWRLRSSACWLCWWASI